MIYFILQILLSLHHFRGAKMDCSTALELVSSEVFTKVTAGTVQFLGRGIGPFQAEPHEHQAVAKGSELGACGKALKRRRAIRNASKKENEKTFKKPLKTFKNALRTLKSV